MHDPAALVAFDDARVALRAAELRASGWQVQHGWALPDRPWDQSDRRVACQGSVADEQDVSAAVLAAARGALILAVVRASEPLMSRLVADLARVGSVDVDTVEALLPAELDDDEWALLRLLAGGTTIAEAARQRHLSTRSAERRLAAARRKLGVRSTAEAVSRYRGPAAAPGDLEVHR